MFHLKNNPSTKRAWVQLAFSPPCLRRPSVGPGGRWGCEVPTELVCETWPGAQREIDVCLGAQPSAAGSARPCTSWGQKPRPRVALQGWRKPPRTAGSSVRLAPVQRARVKGPRGHAGRFALGVLHMLGCLGSTAELEPPRPHLRLIVGPVPWPSLDGCKGAGVTAGSTPQSWVGEKGMRFGAEGLQEAPAQPSWHLPRGS